MAKDGLSLLFLQAIRTRSFTKEILRKIMSDKYHERSTCGGMLEEWSLLGQATGGAAQVEVMPTAVNKHDNSTEDKMKDRCSEKHMQCDCIMLIIIKKADERPKAELEV